MSGNKDIVYKSKQQMGRNEIAAFLRDLAARIELGSVTLTGNGPDTPVKIPDQVNLQVEYEIKHKPAGDRSELELEISWGPNGGGKVGLA